MKILRRINCFTEGFVHDLRLFNPKASLIIGLITLILGVFSWFVGGTPDTVNLIYIFPRWALSTGVMYFLWLVSFVFAGIIIGGIFFGCEKFKRREASKILVFFCLSLLFTLCVYPTFFKALAPFITFILLFTAAFFCFLSILVAKRIFSLWTIMLCLHFAWLTYNGCLSLVFALIN